MKPKLYDSWTATGAFFILICFLFLTFGINKLIPLKNGDKEDEIMELIENLNDKETHNKLFSIVSLGYLGDYRSEVALFKLLDDSDLNIRWKTYIALSRIGSARARDAVENSVAKESQSICDLLANAIADSSYENCLSLEEDIIAIGIPMKESLKKMLESQNPLVRRIVTEALDRINAEK